jgi:hypothetical protein
MEQFFKNLSQTTLTASMDATQTTLTVASASNFPTSGNFRVIVDFEIMKVTGVSGTTFTVVRGDGGTTGATHANAAPLAGIMTKESLETIRGESVVGGSVGATYASNFTQQAKGRIFLPNDAPWMAHDDGTTINYYGHPQWRRLYPPDDTLFSWRNQGGAVVINTNGTLYLSAPASTTDQLRIREKARPSSPPWTLEVMAQTHLYPAAFLNCGICAIDSVSGRVHALKVVIGSGPVLNLASSNFNSVTSFNADTASVSMVAMPMPIHWFKIQDDNTNLICSYSHDGYTYRVLSTVGRTSFLTNGADKIGFFADAVHATLSTGITICSWKEN